MVQTDGPPIKGIGASRWHAVGHAAAVATDSVVVRLAVTEARMEVFAAPGGPWESTIPPPEPKRLLPAAVLRVHDRPAEVILSKSTSTGLTEKRPVKTLPFSVRIPSGTPRTLEGLAQEAADRPGGGSGHDAGTDAEALVVVDRGQDFALGAVR